MSARRICLTLCTTLACCASPVALPPPAAVDPAAHEVIPIAFGREDCLLLERVIGPHPGVALVHVRADEGPTRPEPLPSDLGAALQADGPPVDELPARVFGALEPAWLAAGDYRLAEPDSGASLTTRFGELALADDAIVLRSEHPAVTVARLSAGMTPRRVRWWRDPDERWAALTAEYDGTPRVIDLRLVRLAKVGARALAQAGFVAHGDRRYREAAELWGASLELDPDEASVHYNVACARALLGERDAALEALARAIELGGDRYRALAPTDPDLTVLRNDPTFEELTARPGSD